MAQPFEMNIQVVEWATEAMKKQLGTIDDLPYELANTISNIYYRAGQIFLEDHGSGSLLEVMTNTPDQNELVRGYAQGVSALDKLKAIPDMVSRLRSIDKTTHPNLYAMMWNLLLDMLKYDIKNAMDKPEIWRRIERFFRRPTTPEFPRLVELFSKTLSAIA